MLFQQAVRSQTFARELNERKRFRKLSDMVNKQVKKASYKAYLDEGEVCTLAGISFYSFTARRATSPCSNSCRRCATT